MGYKKLKKDYSGRPKGSVFKTSPRTHKFTSDGESYEVPLDDPQYAKTITVSTRNMFKYYIEHNKRNEAKKLKMALVSASNKAKSQGNEDVSIIYKNAYTSMKLPPKQKTPKKPKKINIQVTTQKSKVENAFIDVKGIYTPDNLPLEQCINAQIVFDDPRGNDQNVDKTNKKLEKIFGPRIEEIDWKDNHTVDITFDLEKTRALMKKLDSPKSSIPVPKTKNLSGYIKVYRKAEKIMSKEELKGFIQGLKGTTGNRRVNDWLDKKQKELEPMKAPKRVKLPIKAVRVVPTNPDNNYIQAQKSPRLRKLKYSVKQEPNMLTIKFKERTPRLSEVSEINKQISSKYGNKWKINVWTNNNTIILLRKEMFNK